MDFFTFIKAVGTGVKGNRDLSFDESAEMMRQILSGEVHGERIAAALLGWRLKPETIEEFQGALSTCDTFITKKEIPNSIELGYPYDGKLKSPYLIKHIAELLKTFDIETVVIGDAKVPAKDGVTLKEIMEETSHDAHLHYFERKKIYPALHALTPLRNRLGLRTALNTLEKLHGVANSPYAITGLFHKPYLKKYAAIFGSRYKRLGLLQGNEGSPELFKKSTLSIVENGQITEYTIDPAIFGIKDDESNIPASKEAIYERSHNPTETDMAYAKLNTAIYAFISEKVESIEAGFEKLN